MRTQQTASALKSTPGASRQRLRVLAPDVSERSDTIMFLLQIIPNYLEMLSRESNKNLISGFPSVYILGGDSASLEENI
jgi:hypothetical protein